MNYLNITAWVKGKGKADDLYRGFMQFVNHRRTALRYPLVHWTLCRCQQYGAFSMKALAKYQVVLLGEQRHIRCQQLAQGYDWLKWDCFKWNISLNIHFCYLLLTWRCLLFPVCLCYTCSYWKLLKLKIDCWKLMMSLSYSLNTLLLKKLFTDDRYLLTNDCLNSLLRFAKCKRWCGCCCEGLRMARKSRPVQSVSCQSTKIWWRWPSRTLTWRTLPHTSVRRPTSWEL